MGNEDSRKEYLCPAEVIENERGPSSGATSQGVRQIGTHSPDYAVPPPDY